MPSTLPPVIERKLHSTRARLRFVDLALGLARAILAAALVLVVLFALDTMLEPPLPVVRAFALFMVLVAVSAVAVFMAQPLRRRLDDDQVALLVEREYPELNGGLVSSVQLGRELQEGGDSFVSSALIRSTIERAARQVEQVDFQRVVPARQLVPLWGLLLAATLGGGFLAAQPGMREYLRIFAQRVIRGEDARYPSLVRLEVRVPEALRVPDDPYALQVAKGDDLDVDVVVTKGAGLVDRLLVHARFADADGIETRDLVRYDQHFRKSYPNVTDPFEFYVEDPRHGAETPRYRVRVVQRPWVEQYAFLLVYPAHIGKAPEVVRQPDLQVPIGTRIAYAVISNKPLAEARLLFERDEGGARDARGRRGKTRVVSEEAKERPLVLASLAADDAAPSALAARFGLPAFAGLAGEMKLSAEGRAARAAVGSFAVTRDTRFRFHLVSREGLESGRKAVVFSVRAVPDRRPVVSIPMPGRRKLATPQAKVPLRIEARDDYGLRDLVLLVQVQRSGEAESEPQTVALEGVTAGARSLTVEHVLEIPDFRLRPGDRIRYRAKAYDHNLDESKNFKESRAYEVEVVRPEDLERILQDRIAGIRERLESARKEQLSARDESLAFVRELGPESTVLSEDHRRGLQRLGHAQRRVAGRLGDVKEELEEIRSERELNRLTEEGSLALVNELHEGVADLSDRASPLVSRALEEARGAPRLDERTRARLARVPDQQEEIAEAIAALVARIEKWGDFTEVLQEVRDLLRGEETIIDGTREAVKGGR